MASGDTEGHSKGPVTRSFRWNIMWPRRQSEINFEGNILIDPTFSWNYAWFIGMIY